MLEKLVAPHWRKKLVTDITKADVEKLLAKIAEGRARPRKEKPNNRARRLQGAKPIPVRANRTGEVLRKMFNLAIGWGWCSDNPANGFYRRIENPRERFLSQEEIARLPLQQHSVRSQNWSGRRAKGTGMQPGTCPPDDNGGPPGFDMFLEAMADPNHPEHEELCDWLGGPFDPARPDEAALRKAVAALAGKWSRKPRPRS